MSATAHGGYRQHPFLRTGSPHTGEANDNKELQHRLDGFRFGGQSRASRRSAFERLGTVAVEMAGSPGRRQSCTRWCHI